MFPAYGAQIVHMPFGSVYTSLQTGVVDVAENGVNVYLANKHYEVAPVLSMTEHEANNSLVWVSDKLWNSLTPEQQGWVQAAADEVNKNQPAKAIELEHQSQDKLKSIGVKIVTDVDKSGFIADRRSLSRQARQGTRPARREDQGPDPGDQVGRDPSACRPGERRDPYAAAFQFEQTGCRLSINDRRRWLGPGVRRDDERL